MAGEKVRDLLIACLTWLFAAALLAPMENVGYMGDIYPMIVFVAYLTISPLFLRARYRAILTPLLILVVIKVEYYGALPWYAIGLFFARLASDVALGVHGLFHHDVGQINAGVRTIAFFGVILFGARLLMDAAERPAWLLPTTLAGEGVLIALAARAGVHDGVAMATLFLSALAMLGIRSVWRHLPVVDGSVSLRRRLLHSPFLSLAGLLAVLATLSIWTPKGVARDFHVHAWWHSLFARRVETAAPAAPYGANDAHLGGNFNGSTAVMFRVIAKQSSYYPIESFSTYTGAGWERGAMTAAASGVSTHVPRTRMTQQVWVESGTYPAVLGANRIISATMRGGARARFVPAIDAWTFGSPLHAGEHYTVVSTLEHVNPHSLASVTDGNLVYAFRQALQLPANFPQRDILLAHQITVHAVTPYAKLQAIIAYLQSHESYQTQGIPVPRPGQDFVDQFLFETHRGYCDQFSTAAAILARVVGIPTRWVKGYISVPADPTYHGAQNEYILRGTDAHSWFEAWFAGYGFVPFEATPSAALAEITQEKMPSSSSVIASQRPNVTPPVQHAIKQAVEKKKQQNSQSAASVPLVESFLVLFALLIFFAGIIRFARRRSSRRSLRSLFQSEAVSAGDFSIQANRLLHALERRIVYPRASHETLREWGLRQTDDLDQKELMEAIAYVERVRYGPEGRSEGGAPLDDPFEKGRLQPRVKRDGRSHITRAVVGFLRFIKQSR